MTPFASRHRMTSLALSVFFFDELLDTQGSQNLFIFTERIVCIVKSPVETTAKKNNYNARVFFTIIVGTSARKTLQTSFRTCKRSSLQTNYF
jgi:hypothetical protein